MKRSPLIFTLLILTLLFPFFGSSQTQKATTPTAPKKKSTSSVDFVQLKDQKIKIKETTKISVTAFETLTKKEWPLSSFSKNEIPQVSPIPIPPSLTEKEWMDLILMQKPYQPSLNGANPTDTQPLPLQYKVLTLSPLKDSNLNIVEIEPITLPEFKLIEALVMLNLKENYELALALLSESVEEPRYKIQGHWSLSQAALPLGLRHEAIHQLAQIEASEKGEWKVKSLKGIMDLAKTTELDLGKKYYNSALAAKIDPATWGAFAIATTKFLIDDKKLQEAQNIIQLVPELSPLKAEAHFLKALINYRSNQIDEAIVEIQNVYQLMAKTPPNWDLKSLAALTLARIYFQREDYPKAFAEYQKIEKNNAVWLQSLIEASWAQILSKDYEGAAGNMFSLHTDYFKGAYQPESYIVRTVSYLNLCQFGDSMTVLQQFLRKYSQTDKSMDLYLAKTNQTLVYETVKKLLLNPNQRSVDGLPRSLIIEMARDPEFLGLQKKINEIEDEAGVYDKIQKDLKEKERKWIIKINEIKKRQQEIHAFLKEDHDEGLKKNVQAEHQANDRKLAKIRILQEVSVRAYQLLLKFQKSAIPRLMTKKDDIKKEASIVLFSKLKAVSADLKHWLEQSELLHYEIYSGAGEHLRYQMGTAEEPDKKQQLSEAEIKAKKAEAHQQWEFKGEIWEDEIGHFRSSLKNVCPEEKTR